MLSPHMEELERQLAAAVRLFEPRIINQTLTVKATVERHLVTIEMNGELWANPVSEKLFIKTSIDLENGQCSLGDGGHG
jgi:type VI secretion system protein ImpF